MVVSRRASQRSPLILEHTAERHWFSSGTGDMSRRDLRHNTVSFYTIPKYPRSLVPWSNPYPPGPLLRWVHSAHDVAVAAPLRRQPVPFHRNSSIPPSQLHPLRRFLRCSRDACWLHQHRTQSQDPICALFAIDPSSPCKHMQHSNDRGSDWGVWRACFGSVHATLKRGQASVQIKIMNANFKEGIGPWIIRRNVIHVGMTSSQST